jgi:murein DD-endopeptidase MepM/ murein hydrolase activator NlpD
MRKAEIGRDWGLYRSGRRRYNEPSLFSIAAIEYGDHLRENRMRNAPYLILVALTSASAFAQTAPTVDGFDYPFGPPGGLPRCQGTVQCTGGWQNVQDFRENNHLGEDWNFGFGDDDLGSPVYAVANGEVMFAGDGGANGAWKGVIIVKHHGTNLQVPGGAPVSMVTSMYAHLDVERITEWVTVGASVTRGRQIGVIGPTPVGSTGPHLHFEVRTDVNLGLGPGYSSNANGWVDPSDFIDGNRIRSVVAWGRNEFDLGNVPSPNTRFVDVAGGYAHSLGLKTDGSIVAWGANNFGQTDVPSPNTGFVAVAAGDSHSLGLKDDGSIVAWGCGDP